MSCYSVFPVLSCSSRWVFLGKKEYIYTAVFVGSTLQLCELFLACSVTIFKLLFEVRWVLRSRVWLLLSDRRAFSVIVWRCGSEEKADFVLHFRFRVLLIPLRLSDSASALLSLQKGCGAFSCGHCLVTLSLTINESGSHPLPILMQESFNVG